MSGFNPIMTPVGCYAWLRQRVTYDLGYLLYENYGTDVWPGGLFELRDKQVNEAYSDFVHTHMQDEDVYAAIAEACVTTIWIEALTKGVL